MNEARNSKTAHPVLAVLVVAGLLFAVAGHAGAFPRPGTTTRRATPPPVVALDERGTDEASDGEGDTPSEEVDPLETPEPDAWLPSIGRQCHRYRGARVCDGPRRVPAPSGPASELAEALGLGARPSAAELLRGAPRAEWVEAVAGEAPEMVRWPVDDGRYGRGFGYLPSATGRRLHKGVDIVAPEGSLIRSVADGVVAYSDSRLRGYGNVILIVHGDGSTSLYAHCRATYLFAGQQVRAGQVIGEVGHTGAAMGPHLHFELRREGQLVDPLTVFGQGQADLDDIAEETEESTPAASGRTRPRRPRGRG